MATKAEAARLERESTIAELRDTLPPGTTVYTILRHVSASGMSRRIDVVAIENNEPRWLSYLVKRAVGYAVGKDDAITVNGSGMDMGFALVHNLALTLYPDGFGCIGGGCPSKDHANGDRDYTPHGSIEERTGADGQLCTCHADHWHGYGGYALHQRWL